MISIILLLASALTGFFATAGMMHLSDKLKENDESGAVFAFVIIVICAVANLACGFAAGYSAAGL